MIFEPREASKEFRFSSVRDSKHQGFYTFIANGYKDRFGGKGLCCLRELSMNPSSKEKSVEEANTLKRKHCFLLKEYQQEAR